MLYHSCRGFGIWNVVLPQSSGTLNCSCEALLGLSITEHKIKWTRFRELDQNCMFNFASLKPEFLFPSSVVFWIPPLFDCFQYIKEERNQSAIHANAIQLLTVAETVGLGISGLHGQSCQKPRNTSVADWMRKKQTLISNIFIKLKAEQQECIQYDIHFICIILNHAQGSKQSNCQGLAEERANRTESIFRVGGHLPDVA